MKFAIVFAAVVALASASYLKPIDSGMAELEAIVAAIQSPNTDPATAILLEQQLAEILGALHPIPAPAPAPVETSPVVTLPELIDFPLPDGGAVSVLPAPETPAVVAEPAPVVVAPAAESSPLVQIIVNVRAAAGSEVAEAPAVAAPAPAPVVDASPVLVVDEAVNPPSAVLPSPVEVAPVQVVDAVPEPVLVGEVVIPVAPVVTLPDILG